MAQVGRKTRAPLSPVGIDDHIRSWQQPELFLASRFNSVLASVLWEQGVDPAALPARVRADWPPDLPIPTDELIQAQVEHLRSLDLVNISAPPGSQVALTTKGRKLVKKAAAMAKRAVNDELHELKEGLPGV